MFGGDFMKRLVLSLLLLIACLFLACGASFAGQMYKVVDKDGNVSYREFPSSGSTRSSPAPEAYSTRPAPRPSRETYSTRPRGRQQVDLYVTNWCGYCRKAVAFLKAHGVPYNLYDIEKDKASARRYSALAGKSGVPFAMINGRKISGFSESAYKRALNIK